MASMQSWRKAYGAIKDTTTVSLANLNSDFKDLDVAIVKATNHVECPPKERHLRKVVAATSIARPRADVAYCIHALARRLAKTRNWIVALKTLVVIHRLLREGDPTFREELLNFTQRGRILQLSNFKDDSSPIAWDCSAWVRTYGLFLEERLECFRVLKYDVEAERLSKQGQGPEKGHSRTRELDSQDLLEQLPALQQLLYRLVGCRPEGAANNNYLVQYALALVLKESFKIYCAINDGIINLVDKFFEMPRHEALKALEIYRRAGQQAGSLSDFYENCRGLELARNFQFPTLREPPQTFLATMEEYVKEAPRMVPVREPLELPERLLLTYKPEESEEIPEPAPVEEEKAPVEEPVPVPPVTEVVSPPPKTEVADTGDFLGLDDPNPAVSAIEESNALALAIVPTDGASTTGNTTFQDKGFDPTGWELALVTAPSNTTSSASVGQLFEGLEIHILTLIWDGNPRIQGAWLFSRLSGELLLPQRAAGAERFKRAAWCLPAAVQRDSSGQRDSSELEQRDSRDSTSTGLLEQRGAPGVLDVRLPGACLPQCRPLPRRLDARLHHSTAPPGRPQPLPRRWTKPLPRRSASRRWTKPLPRRWTSRRRSRDEHSPGWWIRQAHFGQPL